MVAITFLKTKYSCMLLLAECNLSAPTSPQEARTDCSQPSQEKVPVAEQLEKCDMLPPDPGRVNVAVLEPGACLEKRHVASRVVTGRLLRKLQRNCSGFADG